MFLVFIAGQENSGLLGLSGRPITAASATRPEHQLRELAGKHQIEVQFHNYAVQADFGSKVSICLLLVLVGGSELLLLLFKKKNKKTLRCIAYEKL